MTDEETVKFLKSNGVDDTTVQNFLDNGVTLAMAEDINDTYLKDLCPQIGQRIKLKKILREYIDSQADTSTCTSQSGDDNFPHNPDIDIDNVAVTLFAERSEFPDFDLKTLLSTSPLGKSVLNHYGTYGTLDSKRRAILTDIIIRHLYARIVNCRMTHEEYNIIAAKIVSLFPSETVGTYFVRPIKKRDSSSGRSVFAKGKLVDKVRNLLYMSGERKRKVSVDQVENNLTSETLEDSITSRHHEAELLWLKNNIEPWEEVQRLWNETFEDRRVMNFTSVHDFIDQFKILQDPRCETLINNDFDKLFPEKAMSLYLKWPTFFDILKQKKEISDQCRLLVELEKTIDDEDKKLPLQMEMLGHLVPPKGRLNRKVKFSTMEAIEGLIVKVESPGDVEKKIEDIKLKAVQRKLSVQPYVLMVGSFTDWKILYIVVDTVKYQFSSALKAFDLLFKLYHVYNARYPPATEHLYLIVQRKIYEIVTDYDRIPPYIFEILSL